MNEPENKKTNHHAFMPYVPEMTLTDYISQKKKEEEDSVDASIKRIKDYIERRRERLITATRNNTDNTMINKIRIIRKI